MTPAEKLAEAKKSTSRNGGRVPNRPVVFHCGIKKLRVELQLTLNDVGKAVGVGGSGIGEIELGCNVTLDTAMKLAKFFGKPIEELWQLVEEK